MCKCRREVIAIIIHQMIFIASKLISYFLNYPSDILFGKFCTSYLNTLSANAIAKKTEIMANEWHLFHYYFFICFMTSTTTFHMTLSWKIYFFFFTFFPFFFFLQMPQDKTHLNLNCSPSSSCSRGEISKIPLKYSSEFTYIKIEWKNFFLSVCNLTYEKLYGCPP